ncbi:reverse transcriptase domain-containing protein [Tanacetum coccineum]
MPRILIPLRTHFGCYRLVSRAKVIENQLICRTYTSVHLEARILGVFHLRILTRRLPEPVAGAVHHVLQCRYLGTCNSVRSEPAHPEDLVPAEDEAPTPPLPPFFLSPRMKSVCTKRVQSFATRHTMPKGSCSCEAEISGNEERDLCLRARGLQMSLLSAVSAYHNPGGCSNSIDTLEDPGSSSHRLWFIVSTMQSVTATPPPVTTNPPPVTDPTTTTSVTSAQLQAMIDEGVTAVLAARAATRNGDDSHTSGTGARRNERTIRECTYQDFMKCQPVFFRGTEEVVNLTQWFERMETVFRISNCTVENQVKFATCTLMGTALTWWNSHARTVTNDVAYAMTWSDLKKKMTTKYCPRNEIKKIEAELWNLKVQGTDVVAYNQRFQELALLSDRMFPEETDKIERYVGGMPDPIYSVCAS